MAMTAASLTDGNFDATNTKPQPDDWGFALTELKQQLSVVDQHIFQGQVILFHVLGAFD